eukprot:Em0113g4a
MAVLIKGKSAENTSKEVDGHLESTTKLLREANCTPLGLNKLADAWDKAQEESFRLAQHQLDTSGTRKRGRDRKAETDEREQTFGEATEEMQERWRALDVSFWKQRIKMAISFEKENAKRGNWEVDAHLGGTTKFLHEANCTPPDLSKLAEMWDSTQAESVCVPTKGRQLVAGTSLDARTGSPAATPTSVEAGDVSISATSEEVPVKNPSSGRAWWIAIRAECNFYAAAPHNEQPSMPTSSLLVFNAIIITSSYCKQCSTFFEKLPSQEWRLGSHQHSVGSHTLLFATNEEVDITELLPEEELLKVIDEGALGVGGELDMVELSTQAGLGSTVPPNTYMASLQTAVEWKTRAQGDLAP